MLAPTSRHRTAPVDTLEPAANGPWSLWDEQNQPHTSSSPGEIPLFTLRVRVVSATPYEDYRVGSVRSPSSTSRSARSLGPIHRRINSPRENQCDRRRRNSAAATESGDPDRRSESAARWLRVRVRPVDRLCWILGFRLRQVLPLVFGLLEPLERSVSDRLDPVVALEILVCPVHRHE